MNSPFLIATLVVLALSILCFLLGGAAIAGAVTGGGQVGGAVGVLLCLAKLLLGLSLVLGALWLIRSPSR